MELIILNDGLYQLVPVTSKMMEHISLLVKEIDCFDLCDILRLHLTTYHESWNTHIMNDGSGFYFYGCICKENLPLKREIVRVGNGEKIEFQHYQRF